MPKLKKPPKWKGVNQKVRFIVSVPESVKFACYDTIMKLFKKYMPKLIHLSDRGILNN